MPLLQRFSAILALLIFLNFTGVQTRIGSADIVYSAQAILVLDAGTDMLGLDGASFFFEATFDETVSYIDRFDFAAIIAEDSFVTISGSTIDGTYGLLSDVAFYPSFSGIFSDPNGLNDIAIDTGTAADIVFGLLTATTVSGADAAIGDSPILSDFGPSSILDSSPSRFLVNGTALYSFSNSSVTATQLAVPEPSSFLAILLVTLSATLRRRK